MYVCVDVCARMCTVCAFMSECLSACAGSCYTICMDTYMMNHLHFLPSFLLEAGGAPGIKHEEEKEDQEQQKVGEEQEEEQGIKQESHLLPFRAGLQPSPDPSHPRAAGREQSL